MVFNCKLVGTKGLNVLIKNLLKDKADVETAKATLETLNILCSNEETESVKEDKDLGVMFTEIFTKDFSNVALLLDILEETDFYIRYETIQLFNTLLKNSNVLHDAILASPMGISRYCRTNTKVKANRSVGRL